MTLKRNKFITLLLILLLCLAAGGYVLSMRSKEIAQAALTSLLEANGLSLQSFTVAHATSDKITLTDITLADNSIDTLKIQFSPLEALKGHIKSINAHKLNLKANKNKNQWNVAGLPSSTQSTNDTPFYLPVSTDEIKNIPVEQAALTNSLIQLKADDWSAKIPVNLTWIKTPNPTLIYTSPTELHYKFQKNKATAKGITAQVTFAPHKNAWTGTWKIGELLLEGFDTPIPPLYGSGTLTAQKDHTIINGSFKSTDKKTELQFKLETPLANPSNSKLTIVSAHIPWSQGTLSTKSIIWHFGKPQKTTFTLKVRSLSLNQILSQLIGDKAKGTGYLSGRLPLTISKDGKITAQKGRLSADGNGTIQLAPDLIPGDNPQVNLVRRILQNLNYNALTLGINSESTDKLKVKMSIEGRNHAVDETRPVKLNVNLEGNMIDFVEQSLLSILNPRKLLEKSRHDQK